MHRPLSALRGEWEPDTVIVCLGYDALDGNKLAGVNLVVRGCREINRLILHQIGHSFKGPASALGLGGGYQLIEGRRGGQNFVGYADIKTVCMVEL